VLGAQALERRNDFLLADLEGIGDHTRGLFEADASIAVSAAHPSQNVKIFFLVGHFIPSGIVERLGFYFRKSYFLRGDQFSGRLQPAVGSHHYPKPHKNSPRLAQPVYRENGKGIFSNQTRRLITVYKSLKLTPVSSAQLNRWVKPPFVRLELTMGQPDR
jgi:hypothetical protein